MHFKTLDKFVSILCVHGYITLLKLTMFIFGLFIDVTNNRNELIRLSARHGQLEILKYLIKSLMTINLSVNNGFCAACGNGHLKVVKYLLSLDSINANMKNNLPIRYACRNGQLKIVKYLLGYIGVDPTVCRNICVRSAIKNNHMNVAKYLLDICDIQPWKVYNDVMSITMYSDKYKFHKNVQYDEDKYYEKFQISNNHQEINTIRKELCVLDDHSKVLKYLLLVMNKRNNILIRNRNYFLKAIKKENLIEMMRYLKYYFVGHDMISINQIGLIYHSIPIRIFRENDTYFDYDDVVDMIYIYMYIKNLSRKKCLSDVMIITKN